MKDVLLMNFAVDKANKKIMVEREFNAPLPLVWSAWTESELLDQWWAPKPWQARTKFMDFTVGGHWLYAMVGPEGEEHWSRADFKSIEFQKSYSGLDGFCDEHGNMNENMPQSLWENKFTQTTDDTTTVNIAISYDKLEDLETIIEMGFKEGFTAGLENLDALFKHPV